MAEKTPEQEKDINKSIGNRIQLTNELLKNSEKLGLSQQKVNELQQQELQLRIDALEAQTQDLSLSEEQRVKAQQKIALRQQELQALKDTVSETERLLELQGRLNKNIEGFANAWRGGILEQVMETGVNFSSLAESVKKSFTLTNMAGMAAATLVQSTMAAVATADKAQASLAAATGAGQGYSDLISEVRSGSTAMGVGIEKSAEAIGALHSGMSLFTMQNTATKEALTRTTAELTSLGISAETSAHQMEFGMRIMGQTGAEAAAGAEDMAKFAIGIGVAPAKMADEFKAAGPKLAGYGKQAQSVFMGLARQSKKLGISMSDLLGITEQFDTFEGASKAAGQLNSMLGGPFLDSMQLLSAETEEQRVQMLQNSILMSGKSFDSMSRLEKKAIAQAAGINDMAVANNMFSESAQAAAADMDEQSISSEELEKRQKAAVDMTTKLKMIMESFAVAVMPLVNGLQWVVTTLLEWNDTLGGYLIPGLAIGVIGLFLFAKMMGVAAAATTVLGGATGPASGGLVALGKALPAVGAGLAAAAPGMAVAGIKLGLAFILIGGGIGLAAAGIALLVMAFVELLKVVVANISIMPQVVLTIIALSYAFQILAVSAAAAGIGFAVFAAGAVLLAGSFALLIISAAGIVILGAALQFLGMRLKYVQTTTSTITDEIKTMLDGLHALAGENGLVKFVTLMETIEEDKVENLEKIMDQAERFVHVQMKMKAFETAQSVADSVADLLNFLNPTGSDANNKNQREIILELNGRELGKAVTEVLDGKMNMRIA